MVSTRKPQYGLGLPGGKSFGEHQQNPHINHNATSPTAVRSSTLKERVAVKILRVVTCLRSASAHPARVPYAITDNRTWDNAENANRAPHSRRQARRHGAPRPQGLSGCALSASHCVSDVTAVRREGASHGGSHTPKLLFLSRLITICGVCGDAQAHGHMRHAPRWPRHTQGGRVTSGTRSEVHQDRVRGGRRADSRRTVKRRSVMGVERSSPKPKETVFSVAARENGWNAACKLAGHARAGGRGHVSHVEAHAVHTVPIL